MNISVLVRTTLNEHETIWENNQEWSINDFVRIFVLVLYLWFCASLKYEGLKQKQEKLIGGLRNQLWGNTKISGSIKLGKKKNKSGAKNHLFLNI